MGSFFRLTTVRNAGGRSISSVVIPPNVRAFSRIEAFTGFFGLPLVCRPVSSNLLAVPVVLLEEVDADLTFLSLVCFFWLLLSPLLVEYDDDTTLLNLLPISSSSSSSSSLGRRPYNPIGVTRCFCCSRICHGANRSGWAKDRGLRAPLLPDDFEDFVLWELPVLIVGSCCCRLGDFAVSSEYLLLARRSNFFCFEETRDGCCPCCCVSRN